MSIGVTELLVIGALAVVLLGPEQAARYARVLGRCIGMARQELAEIKDAVDADEQEVIK